MRNKPLPDNPADTTARPGRGAQCSTSVTLNPFEPWAAHRGFSCGVRLGRTGSALMLGYSVHGPLEQLAIPAVTGSAGYKPELWRATCMECFLSREHGSAYTEWNFSPAGHWWVCAFESCRVPAQGQPEKLRLPQIRTRLRSRHLELNAVIAVTDAAPLGIGPAVILEHADGRLSHWAVAHPDQKPDFHNPLTMSLTL